MTTTAPTPSSALAPLVDVLLATPLDTLDVPALQAQIVTVTPQVARLQGWLTAAAGQLDHLTAGSVHRPGHRPGTEGRRLARPRSSTPPRPPPAPSSAPPGCCGTCRW